MIDRLIMGITVAATLAVVPAALATAPRSGAYKGTLAYKGTTLVMNGFSDPVTFSISPSGSTMTQFAFGTFGCLGSGGRLTPGTNYWLGVLKKIASMTVSKSGSFTGGGKTAHSQTSPTLTDTITYTARGSFNKAGTTASGTITLSEKLTGPSLKTPESCGPSPYTFTATHG